MENTKSGKPYENIDPIVLDWKEKQIALNKGRFVFFIGRPERALILERDAEIKNETPLNRDKSFATPDTSEQDKIDANYYEKVKVKEPTGYGEKGAPELHRANAFRLIYKRYIYIPEEVDLFGEEIEVHEAIGDGDEPDALAIHILRNPLERDLKKMHAAINNGKYEPDKKRGRGLQKYVQESYLKKAMTFYTNHLRRIENATIEDQFYSDDRKDLFLQTVDPLIQRRVVEVLVKALMDAAQD